MKLNLFILQDELRDSESYVFCNTGTKLVFDHFEEYAGQDIEADCLYLADASKITADLVLQEKFNLLCFGTVPNRILQYRRCSILMLPERHLTDRYANRIGGIFAKYNRWSENLLMLAMANDAIRQIFTSNLLEEVFENPIMMQTANGLFGITCGTLPADFDSRRWRDIAEHGRETLLEGAVDYGELAIQESIREPFLFERTENYTLLGLNAFYNDVLQGRLVHCNSNREFTDGYLSLATYFNDILAGVIERNINDEIVGHGNCNVFVELLGSWHTEAGWLDKQLDFINWDRNAPHRLAVVSSKTQGASSGLAKMVGENLRNLFPDDYVFPYRDDYLIIMKVVLDEDDSSDRLEGIAELLDVSAAVSLPFYDVSRLRSTYKQCQYLLEDENFDWDKRIRFFDDAVFRHFITSYKIDRDFKWLLHPRVSLLASYDKAHGSKLVQCLQTIIECGFRKKDAAAKLCVHHNTITYRIERIRSISGIDLDVIGDSSQDELFHILLSCKLLSEFSSGE